jgi:hypothetical protein
MTLPNHKIEIMDLTEKAKNYREESLKNDTGLKPFIFKGFKTEADRIKEAIRNNSFLYKTPSINKKKNLTKINNKEEINDLNISNPENAKMNINYMIKNKIILQPQMRFTARTDLERVYDSLNERFEKQNEKNILNRQLKNIGLYSFDKPKDIIKKATLLNNNYNKSLPNIINTSESFFDCVPNRGYNIIKNYSYVKEDEKEKIINQIYGKGNIYYVPKYNEYKPWARKLDLNSEAWKILKEYHIKTHFKAAEEIAENKIITKKIDKERIRNKFLKKEKSKNKVIDPFKFEKYHLNDSQKKIEYSEYTKNENPFIEKKKEVYDKSTLNALSNLAFKEPEKNISKSESEEEKIIEKNNSENNENEIDKKNLVDEHNVLIDGELYYKDSQFDIIANKVLNSCKIYKKKSKYNNCFLKKKQGKLMITHGLSVRDFEKKYHLE